jgi:hypothetical protein
MCCGKDIGVLRVARGKAVKSNAFDAHAAKEHVDSDSVQDNIYRITASLANTLKVMLKRSHLADYS